MLVNTGNLIACGRRQRNPIPGLKNLNHYSDPALSELTFHSESLLREILPIRGERKMEQADPALAMEYRPEAFNGLGGYGFSQNNRWMMYEADPTPFLVERTIGVVFSLEGSVSNDMIFGLAKFNAFNTHWRVQTNTNQGGYVNYGRQDTAAGAEFPVLIPAASPGAYIMIVRQVSLDRHEFYINSCTDPVIINPQDSYWTSNRARLMFGRIDSSRSEVTATIGPVFDAFSLISLSELKSAMKYLSLRTGIPLI